LGGVGAGKAQFSLEKFIFFFTIGGTAFRESGTRKLMCLIVTFITSKFEFDQV